MNGMDAYILGLVSHVGAGDTSERLKELQGNNARQHGRGSSRRAWARSGTWGQYGSPFASHLSASALGFGVPKDWLFWRRPDLTWL